MRADRVFATLRDELNDMSNVVPNRATALVLLRRLERQLNPSAINPLNEFVKHVVDQATIYDTDNPNVQSAICKNCDRVVERWFDDDEGARFGWSKWLFRDEHVTVEGDEYVNMLGCQVIK